MSFLFVLDLPLTQAAGQFEEPALYLGLSKSEVVVYVHVVVASCQNGHYSQSCEQAEKSNGLSLAVLLRVFEVVDHELEDNDRGKSCDFHQAKLEAKLNDSVACHAMDLLLDCIPLDILLLLILCVIHKVLLLRFELAMQVCCPFFS